MDRLWSPWRARYIASGVDAQRDGCVFCLIAQHPEDDETNFVLHRAQHAFVVLNLYPYISGHLMVVPYLHTGEFDSLAKEISDELMDLTTRAQTIGPLGQSIEMEKMDTQEGILLLLRRAVHDELLRRLARQRYAAGARCVPGPKEAHAWFTSESTCIASVHMSRWFTRAARSCSRAGW